MVLLCFVVVHHGVGTDYIFIFFLPSANCPIIDLVIAVVVTAGRTFQKCATGGSRRPLGTTATGGCKRASGAPWRCAPSRSLPAFLLDPAVFCRTEGTRYKLSSLPDCTISSVKMCQCLIYLWLEVLWYLHSFSLQFGLKPQHTFSL